MTTNTQLTFSDPVRRLEINDWPIGGKRRGQVVFEIETDVFKGVERVSRRTTNKHGQWCQSKKTTYAPLWLICTGSDGKTYLISTGKYNPGAFYITESNLRFDAGQIYQDQDPEGYKAMQALFQAVQGPADKKGDQP